MRAFVIYNPNDSLSTEMLAEVVRSCNLHGIYLTLFPGTFADEIDKKIQQYNLQPSVHAPAFTQGEIGCFISHYELWLKCIELHEPIIILEHDAYMKQPLPINVLDMFDEILNLDYCASFRKDEDKYNMCSTVDGAPVISQLFSIDNKALTWKSAKASNVSGAHAYIIKPAAAKKLTSAAGKNGFLPADVHINGHYVTISISNPSIFRFCDFMLIKKHRVKFSSTKGHTNGKS